MMFGGGQSKYATLSFIDLAGVESFGTSKPAKDSASAVPAREVERKSINRSLLALMQLLSGAPLPPPSTPKGKKAAEQPKLTQLLAPYLTPESHVITIYTLRSETECAATSLDVLKMTTPPSKMKITEVKAKDAEPAVHNKRQSTIQKIDVFDDAVDAVDRALKISGGGVTWPHARLMVRGSGGVGKSTTIEAMMGKRFDVAKASTVGAGMHDIELDRQELEVVGGGTAFKAYDFQTNEYASALAAHVAALDKAKGQEAYDAKPSMLEVVKSKAGSSRPGIRRGLTSLKLMGTPQSTAMGQLRVGCTSALAAEAASVAQGGSGAGAAASTASTASSAASAAAAASSAPSQEYGKDSAESAEATELLAPTPHIPLDLLTKYREGKKKQRLVLKVQDTGGQPIFLSILELLTTPECTVYLVVFNLRQLQEDFDSCVNSLAEQLMSIYMFAANAPVILAGTRKDEVTAAAVEGNRLPQKELRSLSDQLLAELKRRCAPAVDGLIMNPSMPNNELCYFGVENSKGLQGDATIRELIKAIEQGAQRLPSMNQKVPLPWLQIYDELRRKGNTQRRISLAQVAPRLFSTL